MRRWFRTRRAETPAEPRERVRMPGPETQGPGPARISDWRSYDEVAEEYERVHAPYTAEPARDLLQLAEAGPGARVLDVGTGTAAAVELSQPVVGDEGIVVGVDPAPRMLQVAHRHRPELRLAAADVLDLPFQDETFDVVQANFALAYFTKLDTSLFDMIRVLRRGGRLAASSWGAGEDELTRTWRLLAEEAVGREVLKSGLKDEAPWGEKLSDPARFEGVLRDMGLRPVRVERRKYRFTMSREDYIIGHETEASGRFIKHMLGPRLWSGFQERVRRAYADSFPEQLVDFRDVLLAVGVKPD